MNFQAPSFGRVIYRPENQDENIYKASIGCNGFIGNRFRFWAIKDCLETTYLPGLKQKNYGDVYIMYGGINQIEGANSPNVKYQKVVKFFVRTYHIVFDVEEAFQFDEFAHPARFMNLQEYVRNVKDVGWQNCAFIGENEENRNRIRGGLEYKNPGEKLLVTNLWQRKSLDAWHDTFTIAGDAALSNSDIGSPVFCKTYPNDFTKGSFKIIGMITNHDVYETIPFRKKGMKNFSEVKINLSFAEFFASNRTDSRKRVNRKEKRRKKFDVENNPDKFWKLSKNNFILKEEIGGAKKKHPVHRAYLHPEFLRPKYLIAAAMAKYLPFVGIVVTLLGIAQAWNRYRSDRDEYGEITDKGKVVFRTKNRLYRLLPHIIFLLTGIAFYTGWKIFDFSVEKLSHLILKGLGFLLWAVVLLAYLMKIDTDEDPGSQLYTAYGQFTQQQAHNKKLKNPFLERAHIHAKFLELKALVGNYPSPSAKSKLLIRFVKLGIAAGLVFGFIFKLELIKEVVPFVVPVALLLVLCVLDHSKPLLKSESYKSIDIRLVHRMFLRQEIISLRSHLLQKPSNDTELNSPTDDKLLDEIQELTKLAQEFNKKRENSVITEKTARQDSEEYDL